MTLAPRRAAAVIVMCLLAACGGGGGGDALPAAATEVASGQSAQQALPASGGTVTLSTREGARFELLLPDGALPAGATVSLTTATATARQRFLVRLAPAGTVLLKPATITVTLPVSMALPSTGTLTYDGVPLAATRLPDGRLQAQISHFAGVPVAGTQKQAQAADAPPACGGLPDFSEGGFTASAAVDVEIYGQCMVGAVNALAATGQYAEAVRVAATVAAYLQSTGSGDAAGYIARAGTLACAAYREAAALANRTPVTSMGTLHTVLRPVLFWEKTSQQLGASCNIDYEAIATAKTGEALAYYASRKPAIVDTASTAYSEAVTEAREGKATVQQVQSLPGGTAVNTLARAQHEERAQPGLLDAMLQAPWQRCRDSGNQDKLIELMQLMDSPPAVKTAAQYCGTLLAAIGKTAMDPAIGGVSAGRQSVSGSVGVQADGKLQLSGPIRALQCPVGSVGGSESLQLRLGSTVLQTITAAPYLASTLEIDIAGALRAANIEAATFTGATLTLHRSGSPCGGFWGDNPEPLLSLSLVTDGCRPAPGQQVCVSLVPLPDGVQAVGMNRRGDILYRDLTVEPAVFKLRNARGDTQTLPADFQWAQLLEDGRVMAAVLRYSDDFQRAAAELLLWQEGTRSTIQRWAEAFLSRGPMLQQWAVNPDSGAVFVVEYELRPNEPADLGWCARTDNGGQPSAQWECNRYRVFTAATAGMPPAEVAVIQNAPARRVGVPQRVQQPNAQGDWRLLFDMNGAPNGRPGAAAPSTLLRVEYRAGSLSIVDPFSAPGVSAAGLDPLALAQQILFDRPSVAGWGADVRAVDDRIETNTRSPVLFVNGSRGAWLDPGNGRVVAQQGWAALDGPGRPDLESSTALDGNGRWLVRRAGGGGWLILTPTGVALP